MYGTVIPLTDSSFLGDGMGWRNSSGAGSMLSWVQMLPMNYVNRSGRMIQGIRKGDAAPCITIFTLGACLVTPTEGTLFSFLMKYFIYSEVQSVAWRHRRHQKLRQYFDKPEDHISAYVCVYSSFEQYNEDSEVSTLICNIVLEITVLFVEKRIIIACCTHLFKHLTSIIKAKHKPSRLSFTTAVVIIIIFEQPSCFQWSWPFLMCI